MEEKAKSQVFKISNCPVPAGNDRHEGLDALLDLLSWKGVHLYKAEQTEDNAGPGGLIAREDVVLVKVNAQWKYRGCTNSDLVRGLIRRILEHPEGFEGEVVIFDNGQGQGAMDGNPRGWGRYSDSDVHANAEDESHSYLYLVEEVFKDDRVSCYLLDDARDRFISYDDHTTDGYRKTAVVSYPCFTTRRGTRVELREGIWNGSAHSPNLKLINAPVLKRHYGCGATACLKHYYGILTMSYKPVEYHDYNNVMGMAVAEMLTKVRAPVLNILDCIWVSPKNHYGYPHEAERLNVLAASLDPVALDYWGGKHALYPTDRNPEHNPDLFAGFGDYLKQAKEAINANGGIFGRPVNFGDEDTELLTCGSIIENVPERERQGKVSASLANKMRQRADAGM